MYYIKVENASLLQKSNSNILLSKKNPENHLFGLEVQNFLKIVFSKTRNWRELFFVLIVISFHIYSHLELTSPHCICRKHLSWFSWILLKWWKCIRINWKWQRGVRKHNARPQTDVLLLFICLGHFLLSKKKWITDQVKAILMIDL